MRFEASVLKGSVYLLLECHSALYLLPYIKLFKPDRAAIKIWQTSSGLQSIKLKLSSKSCGVAYLLIWMCRKWSQS